MEYLKSGEHSFSLYDSDRRYCNKLFPPTVGKKKKSKCKSLGTKKKKKKLNFKEFFMSDPLDTLEEVFGLGQKTSRDKQIRFFVCVLEQGGK